MEALLDIESTQRPKKVATTLHPNPTYSKKGLPTIPYDAANTSTNPSN